MSETSSTRNLIKFSHYSTCLILPKEMLEELQWHQGDAVNVALDADRHQLIVSHGQAKQVLAVAEQPPKPAVPTPTVAQKSTEPPVVIEKTPNDHEGEDVLPIPELTD